MTAYSSDRHHYSASAAPSSVLDTGTGSIPSHELSEEAYTGSDHLTNNFLTM